MKSALVRSVRLVMALGVVALATGCIKINSTLMIRPDGSGAWRVGYAMPGYMINQALTMRSIATDLAKADPASATNAMLKPLDLPFLFDEAAIRSRFKRLEPQGIRLAKVETRSRSGWQYADLSVTFDRLEPLLRQPFFDGCGFALTKLGDTSYKLTLSVRRPDQGAIPNMKDPAVSANLTPFFRGLSVVSRIETPGTIRNTNSGTSDDRMATWEWDFDKDPDAIGRLLQDKMIVVFDAAGARLPELDLSPDR